MPRTYAKSRMSTVAVEKPSSCRYIASKGVNWLPPQAIMNIAEATSIHGAVLRRAVAGGRLSKVVVTVYLASMW